MPVGITKLVNPATTLEFTGGINWMGDYNGATPYATGDGVSYQGSSYVAIQATTGNLPTDVNYWGVLAEKGADGAAGLGIIAGGTTGQVLAKASAADYDMEWADIDLQTVVPASTVEDETTYGITPDAGVSDTYARGDHTHGTPAAPPAASDTVVEALNFDIAPSAGVATEYSRADHTHGTPPEPVGGGTGNVQDIVAGSGIEVTENPAGTFTISLYGNPSVTLTGGSTNLMGTTVADVALVFTCNKVMTSRLFSAPVPLGDRERGSGQSGSYTHVGANLTTDTTYQMTVTDGTGSAQNSTSVLFRNYRYWGPDSKTALTPSEVKLLSGSEFASSRSNTHIYDCTGGRYIWICYPSRFGAATFRVGGLEVTFTLTIQDIENSAGYTEQYYCYRSLNIQNGSDIQVVVT